MQQRLGTTTKSSNKFELKWNYLKRNRAAPPEPLICLVGRYNTSGSGGNGSLYGGHFSSRESSRILSGLYFFPKTRARAPQNWSTILSVGQDEQNLNEFSSV